MLVVMGENDVGMAKRDFEPLVQLVSSTSGQCRAEVLKVAWHTHPIDVPEQFANIVADWVGEVLE